MNHLEKFYNYINESDNYSKDYLDDLLQPISDLGVLYTVSDKKVITRGKFTGSEYIGVRFSFNEFEKTVVLSSREFICDDRIWEFFDELISFKNRLENDKVLLSFHTMTHGVVVEVMFITGSVEMNSLFELESIYNILNTRYIAGTTDFYYSIIMRMDKDEKCINIKIDKYVYTRRKLNFFFRDINMDNFVVDIDTNTLNSEIMVKISIKD